MEDVPDSDNKHAKIIGEQFEIQNLRLILWSLGAEWYIITGRYIWKRLQHMHGNIWTWSWDVNNLHRFICMSRIRSPNSQLLINKWQDVGQKYLKKLKAFTEYSTDMEDICNSIDECNPGKKREISLVFDDIIPDVISNKKHHPVVTKLFMRG